MSGLRTSDVRDVRIHDPSVAEADVPHDHPRCIGIRRSVLSERLDERSNRVLVAVEPPGQVGARVGVRVPRDPVRSIDRELRAALQMSGIGEALR